MTKRFILFLVTYGIVICAIAQKSKDKFLLKGSLAGQNEGWVYLFYWNAENKSISDSCLLRNGNFSFAGNIKEPTMASIMLKEEKRSRSNTADVYLEPAVMNMKVRINEFNDAVVTGSATHNEYIALINSKKPVSAKYKTQLDSLNTEKDQDKRMMIRERLMPYLKELEEKDFEFFYKHPRSYVTAYMLPPYFSKLSLDSMRMFYDRMGKRLQASPFGQRLAEEIKSLAGGSPGSKAKNFTATDINGQRLSLSDLKGKYILLDFWASWCIPCRKGNPHLRKLYTQYKDKGIEFIGISDDDGNPEAWRKAVEKDSLPWRHVLRGRDIENQTKAVKNETDINKLFGIHVLPTKILIDSNGIIIGRYNEEETELDAMLKKIFEE